MVYDDRRDWFWARVDRNGPTPGHLPALGPCWFWMRARDSKGYGQTKFGRAGKMLRTHRVAWELVNGPIPNGLKVLHHCDVRPCCRPDHLFLGTDLDNMRDKTAKGRNWTPLGRHINVGSAHPLAKLTDDQVLDIRSRLAAGESPGHLAAAFGVHYNTINRISRGSHWRHLVHGPVGAPPAHVKGSRHHSAKLNEADVVEIRRRLADGDVAAHLAREYGVNPVQIASIRNRRTWKHVT